MAILSYGQLNFTALEASDIINMKNNISKYSSPVFEQYSIILTCPKITGLNDIIEAAGTTK